MCVYNVFVCFSSFSSSFTATFQVQHFSSLEPAEEGVSYGIGALWTDAVVPYCFRPGHLVVR
jgi:hypothetical protein